MRVFIMSAIMAVFAISGAQALTFKSGQVIGSDGIVYDGASPEQKAQLLKQAKLTGKKAGVTGSNLFIVVQDNVLFVDLKKLAGKSDEEINEVIVDEIEQQLIDIFINNKAPTGDVEVTRAEAADTIVTSISNNNRAETDALALEADADLEALYEQTRALDPAENFDLILQLEADGLVQREAQELALREAAAAQREAEAQIAEQLGNADLAGELRQQAAQEAAAAAAAADALEEAQQAAQEAVEEAGDSVNLFEALDAAREDLDRALENGDADWINEAQNNVNEMEDYIDNME